MPQLDLESDGPGGERAGRSRTAAGSMKQDAARAAQAAKEQGAAALEQAKEGVRALGGEAKERAARYAESQKEALGEHLHQFARSVRDASDELGRRDQTMASQFVRQAAGGLESLSKSVSGSSLEDIVGSVRAFGRANPAAFIGGAVLAGLAIGRFARASASRDTSTSAEEWQPGGSAGRGNSPLSQGRASYPGDQGSPSGSASRMTADAAGAGTPSPYGGGGMGTNPARSSGPSSGTDASVTVGSYGAPGEPASMSVGETS